MQKASRLGIAIAALLVMGIAVPAHATHGGIHPTFRLESDYFQCIAGNRLQNVGRNNGQIPTWGLAAPTAALQDGGGCVEYENTLTNTGSYTSPHDLVYQGTFVGNLKQITFELYLASPGSASVAEGTATANLLVDGAVVHTATQTVFAPQTSGNYKKIVFHYTKLDKLFADQDGDGDTEREILWNFSSFNEQQNLFLWGATDAPAKIVFNPATVVGQKFPVA